MRANVDLPQPGLATKATVSRAAHRMSARRLQSRAESAWKILDLEYDVTDGCRDIAGPGAGAASQAISSTRRQRDAWIATRQWMTAERAARRNARDKDAQRGPKKAAAAGRRGREADRGWIPAGGFLSALGTGIDANSPRV